MSDLNAAPTRLHRMILLGIAALAAGTFVFGVLQLRSGGQRKEGPPASQTNSTDNLQTNSIPP